MNKKTGGFKLLKILFVALALTMMMGMSALADEMVLKDGTYSYIGTQEGIYVQMNVPSDGLLTVAGQGYYKSGMTNSVKISLCDSNMKELDSVKFLDYASNKIAQFGVTKGVYYIKVLDAYSAVQYTLAADVRAVNEKSGASKKKAKSIKKNATIEGIVAVGEKSSKADWYKLKLTKKKVLGIQANSAVSGSVKVTLYGPSYKYGTSFYLSSSTPGGEYYSVNALNRNKRIKVKKGTYYLKVQSSYGGNGIYSLKWF